MGRMIDILRNADRRPAAETPEEMVETREESEEKETVLTTEPPLDDDDAVPFIEVGGKREPTLRLIPAPPPSPGFAGEGPGERAAVRISEATDPLPPTPLPALRERGELHLLTIRFQAVHAARLCGRSPVAELIAFHEPDHEVSVQYRSLAAEIARQLPGALPRVLLFTGAAGGVGASTVLLNLAITLARQDTTVTVVDAHLTRPALAGRLGLPGGPGLREVLAGQMPPAWCIQESAQANLLLLPAGVVGRPRHGADLTPILETLRERSDCVLLDAGQWGEGAIATELAGGSDAVYLVMRQDAAAESAALQDEILQQTGRLRGCVLTSLPIP